MPKISKKEVVDIVVEEDVTCETCNGKGRVSDKESCPVCDGTGKK